MKYQHMHINLNNRKIHVHLSLCSNWKGEKTLKKNNEQITPNETLLIRSFIGVNMSNSILDETFFPLANLARVHNTHNSHAKYNIFGFYQIEGHGTARLSMSVTVFDRQCVCRRIDDDVFGQYFSFITVDISNNILCKWSICFQLFGWNSIRLNHFDSEAAATMSHYNIDGNYQCEYQWVMDFLERSIWRERESERKCTCTTLRISPNGAKN